MKRLAVYCGSSLGVDPTYREKAIKLGEMMVKENCGLVYGGGAIGIMGAIADSVLKHGGSASGVIPKFLDQIEITHNGLTELYVSENMPERKNKMYELADGFVALPGGIGTLEELFEVYTWRQLKIHDKPIGILNINGYYDHLIAHINHMVSEGFLQKKHTELIFVRNEPRELLNEMLKLIPEKKTELDQLNG